MRVGFKGQKWHTQPEIHMQAERIGHVPSQCNITISHFSAQSFFALYRSKQESFYDEELLRLKSITSPLHLNNNELVELFT